MNEDYGRAPVERRVIHFNQGGHIIKIDKTQLRIIGASESARYSDSKQSVFDLEAVLNDVKIKLERARDARDKAEKNYTEIMNMIARIEDAEDV
ncbi:MAG: hypothetical protein Q7U66_10655 [Methylobacter sp.]|nr:hypothetical protein [Methylobacter sp.]